MAEVASDSDVEVTAQSRPNPPPKRRRILDLDPSAITVVPTYSKKVTHSLQLKPSIYKHGDCTGDVNEEKDASLWPPSQAKSKSKPISLSLNDTQLTRTKKPVSQTRPSTNQAKKKMRPERIADFSDCPSRINDCYVDDGVRIISSEDNQKRHPAKPKLRKCGREILLNFRCRLDIHKIPVLSTDPLSKAVAQLSVKLKVSASYIMLIRNDVELSVHSTISQLGLGIADIIDCLVITDDKDGESSCDVIKLRLQGKEKGSAQEYSLDKHAPLGSILAQYTSGLSGAAKRKVKFLFDGLKVKHNQTPSQLDMEDGDVIDVWA